MQKRRKSLSAVIKDFIAKASAKVFRVRMHICAIWRIRLNDVCMVVMQSCVKFITLTPIFTLLCTYKACA